MSKHVSTGFLRQVRKRKAKLNNSKLTSYERFLKQKEANFREMDKLTDCKIINQ